LATLTPGLFTYAEWALRLDPDGKTSVLVNLLSQNNSILEDCMAVECQSGNAYEFTQVVKLPTPSRRTYNQGVAATMAAVAKQVLSCSEYGDWSVFDSSLARLGGNMADLRFQEDALHMEGMSQLVASDLFYANRATDPTQFTGLSNLYYTVSTANSQIANNVIDCGGTGNTNASIWLIGWGPRHIHTVFPKGIPAGMQHRDFGELPKTDSGGSNEFPAWRTWLQWNIAVAVEDWRYGVRACNIDYTTFGTGSAPNLIAILAAMVYKPPVMPAGVAPVQTSDDPSRVTMSTRSAFYCNRTVFLQLDLQAQNKTNVLLKMDEWDGHAVLTYRGIPIRVVDALTIAETRVT
jgi:hypothetical protein